MTAPKSARHCAGGAIRSWAFIAISRTYPLTSRQGAFSYNPHSKKILDANASAKPSPGIKVRSNVPAEEPIEARVGSSGLRIRLPFAERASGLGASPAQNPACKPTGFLDAMCESAGRRSREPWPRGALECRRQHSLSSRVYTRRSKPMQTPIRSSSRSASLSCWLS